jgi:DUF4097 and DUF4098 domain-containing protein YvlB
MEPTSYATPDDVTVELRIPAGTIRARATDTDTTELDITGERADRVKAELRPVSGGHKLVISARNGGFGFKSWDRDLRIDLVVPTGTTLDAETGAADVDATGELGAVSIRSGSGDLAFEGVTGNVVAKVASGDVRGGEVGGDLTVHGASGDVSVRKVGGALTCRTASGDVHVDDLGGDAQITGASGDIDLGAVRQGTLTLRSVSGDIAVGVVPGTGVWLDLTSTTGDAVSELSEPAEPTSDARLEIRATVVSGDVRVFASRTRAPDGTGDAR